MTFKRILMPELEKRKTKDERRSGMNRRWIKAPYDGVERRSGMDRRVEPSQPPPSDHRPSSDEDRRSLENLVLTTTLRLEALARLLVAKGILDPEELADMLRTIQAEHQPRQLEAE